MARQINNVSYYAVLTLAVVGGFVAHEAAHWSAGEALGLDMSMSLNRAGPLPGQTLSPAQHMIIDAAGPAFTIATALIAALLAFWRGALLAYPFVFAAFVMRLTASGVSLANPNDEMRVSSALGLGDWTLPLAVPAALLALTIATSLRLSIGWRTNVLSYVLASALVTAVVFADAFMR